MSYCTVLCMSMFFFFKQKTAYEMRISDWSSDVCSSDLSAMHSVMAFTPLPTGWSSLTPLETRMVRSWIWAAAGAAARPTESAIARPAFNLDVIAFLPCLTSVEAGISRIDPAAPGTGADLVEPVERHEDEFRKQHQQEENDHLDQKERHGPDDHAAERHLRHAAHHVQHDADRRRYQADAVVHDEQHADRQSTRP